MKRLKDMTNEELINLTDEEYDKLVDIECMYTGAPLSVEKPVYKDVPVIPKADVEIYEVNGILLSDKAEAEMLLKTINNLQSCVETDYSYNTGYDYKYLSDKKVSPDKQLKKINVYSKNNYNNVKATLCNIVEIKDYNSRIQDEYEEKEEKRNAVILEINDAINDAIETENEIDTALSVYKKYLELSDNDENIAKKFFEASEYSEMTNLVLERINKPGE